MIESILMFGGKFWSKVWNLFMMLPTDHKYIEQMMLDYFMVGVIIAIIMLPLGYYRDWVVTTWRLEL